MQRIYNEQNLEQDFSKDLITNIQQSVQNGRSINLVSSQGIGTSLFFKYFITHSEYKSIYVDFDHLAESTLEEFYTLFLRQLDIQKDSVDKKTFQNLVRRKIEDLLKEDTKVVIILAHFELLKKYFSKDFFDLIKYIRTINSNQIIFIFNTYTPITELLYDKLDKINTNLFGQLYYLTPYKNNDLKEIAQKILFLDTNDEWIQKAMELSGGSYYLLSLLSRTERIENPILDPFIKMYFKRFTENISAKRRKVIEQIGLGKKDIVIDPYLMNLGIVQIDQDRNYKLFSPLFTEYIKQNSTLKFSAGEKKLFSFLKSKIGKIVIKDELFIYVWGEENDASDWALNSMIYRIRNNPVFKEQGYEIESYKKVGYRLIKN